MIRLFTAFILLFLLSTNTFSSEHYKGQRAAAKVPGSAELWYKTGESLPHFIVLDKQVQLSEAEALDWLKEQFTELGGLQFKALVSHKGISGIMHSTYAMFLNDVPIEFVRLTLHSTNGIVHSISGNILPFYKVSNAVTLNEGEARKRALDAVNAEHYKWENAIEEDWLKEVTGDANATFYPSSEIVIMARDINYKEPDLRYAHKFDVFASQPLMREEVYVDAQTGEILFSNDLMMEIDSLGYAHTMFSDLQQITTDYRFPTNDFRLFETGRGNGIHTWNANNSTDLSNRSEFTDGDNEWKDMTGLDQYVTDAHWAAELTYDYLETHFGRNSLDDHGYQMNVYVHYGEAYDNARWDGQNILLGDNNGIPYTTVDIVGHELTHGMTQYSAGLIYMNESGALNESFSDIFGNCIEYFGKPSKFSWRIGEDRGTYIRDMQNPKVRYNPDTYQGSYWYVGPGDNGGVHINSGVQNHWFYLLTEGGNGINDIGKSYNVSGIGMDNAAQIAYENLTAYLSPLSDYEEARFYSIVAAVDIYGNCSPQHAATVNSWYAVGLGDEFISEAVADFTADRLNFCTPPFTVHFSNTSVNGMEYLWDFGDGGSSSDENPSHTYTSVGEFTVKLNVDGDGCGVDEKIEDKFIKVIQPDVPTGQNVIVSKGEVAVLNAQTNSGTIYWYKDADATEILHMGNQFTTAALYSDTVFYLRTVVAGEVSEVGPDIQASLGSGQYSSSGLGLVFDMLQDATLQSVTVNAGTGGSRLFVIEDKTGSKVFERSIDLKAGIQEVDLNAELSIGNNYDLYIGGSTINLWRSSGATFPFETPGICSIKENTIGLDSLYPYFYNWKIKERDCESGNKEISVGVQDVPTGKRRIYNFYAESGSGGGYTYKVRFEFLSETSITYGLYSISGQKVTEITPPAYPEGVSIVDLNQLLDLNTNSGGVYFLTITGGEIEKSERVIISNKGN